MVGERLSDRYEIVGELGRGGMGTVYRAYDPVLERDVAIKLISLSQIDAESEERFRREAQVVAKMDHPAIVPIYDLGAHEDALFFVMPVVDGTTLKSLLRQRSLALLDVIETIAQVADGLDYSHSRGVVHRDIKPENIMVTRESDGEPGELNHGAIRARVMDFGLALTGAVSRLTKSGALPGTLVYLSPEQILSSKIDGRSDIYSLGTILFECLSGELPFSGSRYSLLYRIAHEPPPSLSRYGVEDDLSGLVLRCLAKDPGARPSRGSELAEALRRFALNMAPGERPRPRTDRAIQESSALHLTPMAGRERERERIRQLLEETLQGECHLLLVGGDSGLGKTRLLQAAAEMAAQVGFRVLQGHFSGEGSFPYQGFGEVVQDHFRQLDSGTSSASDHSDLSDLGADLLTLFPFLLEVPAIRHAATNRSDPGLSGQASERSRLHELLARTLTRICDDKPLLILLEHLHASEAAVEALQYLVRRLGPLKILIVGSYRPSEAGRRHAITRLVSAAADDRRFALISLAPLKEGEHRELLATLLAGNQLAEPLVRQLFLASEGNPFFIQELVRWMLEAGDIKRSTSGTWSLSGNAAIARDALPDTIQQVVASRLEQLPDEHHSVLQTASILGRNFDFTDLEALWGDDLEDYIDELDHDGLLEEDRTSRADRLSFASGIVRDVLYRSLSRRRRRLLHRQHAERLESRYSGRLHRVYARLVHHFAEGDVPDKTIQYALALAREALTGFGSEVAVRALRVALEFVEDEVAGGGREAELRSLLATALQDEGHLDNALKEAAKAVRVAERAGAMVEASTAALRAAEIAWQGRRIEETRHWVGRGSEIARRAGSDQELQRLLTLGATLANLSGQYNQAKIYREEAEGIGGSPGQEVVDSGDETRDGTLLTTLSSPLTAHELGRVMTVEELEVQANVFETLLTVDEEGNLVPRLAKEWWGDEDGRMFTFVLDAKTRFSDGEPVLAKHVKRSFERAARHGQNAPAPAIAALVGCPDFLGGLKNDIEGIRVQEERTIVFDLSDPLPVFPSLLTDLRAAITRRGLDGRLLGTGPFRWLDSEQDSDEVTIERNPEFWRSPPKLGQVRFKIVPQAADVAEALRKNEIDLGRDLLPEDLEDILRDPRFRAGLVEATLKDVYYATLNAHGPLTRSPELRRALVCGVRVQDIVWRTLKGFAQPATGVIPPGILGHDPGRRALRLSRREARALISQSELPSRATLRTAVHPILLDRFSDLTEALFEEWESLGIEVEVEEHSVESFLARSSDISDLDVRIGRWIHDYDDPDNFTYEMLHSRHGVLGHFLSSNDLDSLFEEARAESRPVRRQKLYREIELRIAETNCILPLFHNVNYRILGPRVKELPMLSSPPYVEYSAVAMGDRQPDMSAKVAALSKSGTLHVPSKYTGRSLAPEQTLFVEASEIVPNIFETLTKVEEGAHIVPCLASEFRAEDGGKRYHFRIRPNVRFHDGRRLSARDVRYSFERLIGLPGHGASPAMLAISGARDLRLGRKGELSGFQILSDREFVIELERPMSFFPALLSAPMHSIVPERARHFDRNWRDGTVGTGPFRLVRFVAGERVEFEANPSYWRDGVPRSDRLIFDLDISAEQVASEFRNGRLMLASRLPLAHYNELRRDPAFASGYHESPGISTYYLVLNRKRGMLTDDARRRALAAAFEAEEAVLSLGRTAVLAQGLIPPGLVGQEGRGALTGSTDSNIINIRTTLSGLELRCALHPTYVDAYKELWRRLVSALDSFGVKVTTTVFDTSTMTTSDYSEFDLVATRWYADYPDSDAFVSSLHSEDGLDGMLCGDPRIDELIERGRGEAHPSIRHAIYHEIERLLQREALIVPLFHEQVYCFARPEVGNLRLSLGSPAVVYEELTVTL